MGKVTNLCCKRFILASIFVLLFSLLFPFSANPQQTKDAKTITEDGGKWVGSGLFDYFYPPNGLKIKWTWDTTELTATGSFISGKVTLDLFISITEEKKETVIFNGPYQVDLKAEFKTSSGSKDHILEMCIFVQSGLISSYLSDTLETCGFQVDKKSGISLGEGILFGSEPQLALFYAYDQPHKLIRKKEAIFEAGWELVRVVETDDIKVNNQPLTFTPSQINSLKKEYHLASGAMLNSLNDWTKEETAKIVENQKREFRIAGNTESYDIVPYMTEKEKEPFYLQMNSIRSVYEIAKQMPNLPSCAHELATKVESYYLEMLKMLYFGKIKMINAARAYKDDYGYVNIGAANGTHDHIIVHEYGHILKKSGEHESIKLEKDVTTAQVEYVILKKIVLDALWKAKAIPEYTKEPKYNECGPQMPGSIYCSKYKNDNIRDSYFYIVDWAKIAANSELKGVSNWDTANPTYIHRYTIKEREMLKALEDKKIFWGTNSSFLPKPSGDLKSLRENCYEKMPGLSSKPNYER
jgi:hypothetical protein